MAIQQRVRLPSLAPVRQVMSGEIDGEWSYVEPRRWSYDDKISTRRATLSGCLFTYSVWVWSGRGRGHDWRYVLRLDCQRVAGRRFFYDGDFVIVFLDHEARIKRTLLKEPMPEELAAFIGLRELVAWVVNDARSVWSP